MTPFRKLMAANRGEIAIRVFRSSHELGIRTVAIYSHEDRFAIHRLKADEAYEVGKPGEPIRSYLDINAIIELAIAKEVDAIHPGYGFLSENAGVRAGMPGGGDCVGRSAAGAARPAWRQGDRPKDRAGGGDPGAVRQRPSGAARARSADELAEALGFPVIVKAALGGGGRGMRVVESAADLDAALTRPARGRHRVRRSGRVHREVHPQGEAH